MKTDMNGKNALVIKKIMIITEEREGERQRELSFISTELTETMWNVFLLILWLFMACGWIFVH